MNREPVRDLSRRMPEQGRIRTGDTTATSGGGTRPQKLQALRFTSKSKDAIEQIAQVYGGTAQEWKGAPGHAKQWEVYTPLAELSVILPPNCLGDGVTYEKWAGGYNERRCDGITCTTEEPGLEGIERVQSPCFCNRDGYKGDKCKAKLRLTVILRDIDFGGGWRLETSSENAVRELPGMVDLILSLQQKVGLTSAVLVLEQRSKTVRYYDKKTREVKTRTQNYGVPMLRIAESIDAIASGAGALGAGEGPALKEGRGQGGPVAALDSPDAEPAEAEVVIDTALMKSIEAMADKTIDAWNRENPEGPLSVRQVLQTLAAMLTKNPTQTMGMLSAEHGEQIHQLFSDIEDGKVEFCGIRDGAVKVRRQ